MNDGKQMSECEYFESLTKKRDKYLKLYEKYSKASRLSDLVEDKKKMEKYGSKQDEIQDKIDKFKEEKGYLDPADFPHSANEEE